MAKGERKAETVVDPGGVAIEVCPSCGKNHGELNVTKYIHEIEPYTHWAICPVTGDPVQLCIKTRNGSKAEIMGNVTDSLVQADAAGGFMIAVWHPEGTETRTHLHQFNYSNDEKHIERCIQFLRERIDDHVGNAPKKAVLVEQQPPAPPVNMFGAQVIEGDSKPSE